MSTIWTIALQGLGWLVGRVFGKTAPDPTEQIIAASEAKGRSEAVVSDQGRVLNELREARAARNAADADFYRRMQSDGQIPDDGFRRD